MIGVLPGEGEALAQFDSVFLTQFFTGSCSVEATSAIEQEEREAKFVAYGKDRY